MTNVTVDDVSIVSNQRVGLRSVSLVQEEDEHCHSFYFEVNSKPIFVKGANYIPGEIMVTQPDEDYY